MAFTSLFQVMCDAHFDMLFNSMIEVILRHLQYDSPIFSELLNMRPEVCYAARF